MSQSEIAKDQRWNVIKTR